MELLSGLFPPFFPEDFQVFVFWCVSSFETHTDQYLTRSGPNKNLQKSRIRTSLTFKNTSERGAVQFGSHSEEDEGFSGTETAGEEAQRTLI